MKHRSALSVIERLIIAAFIVMIAMLTAVYLIYSVNTFNKLSSERQDSLDVFTSKIAVFLNQKDKSAREVVTELASDTMLEAENQIVSVIAKQNISNKLSALLQQETVSTYFIVYKEPVKLSAYSGVLPMQDRNAIAQYVRSKEIPITCTGKETHWDILDTGNQHYLFLSYEIYGYITAIFCNESELLDTDELLRGSKVCEIVFAVGENILQESRKVGAPDFLSVASFREGAFQSASHEYVIQKSGITGTDISVYQVLKRGDGLFSSDSFPIPLAVISIFTISAAVLLFALRREMRRGIIQPTKVLMGAMQELQEGNEEYRIYPLPDGQEFFELSSSFNHMADEIIDLRIEQYEQRLKQLQSQIKTHFYLNAFTTIQSMTYQNRNEDIRKFVTCLSSYMRYMMQMNQSMVMLQNELRHIESYFAMQQIRFPGSVLLETEIEEGTENWQVPFLSVYSVAENTLKHAMSSEATLHIQIIVKRIDCSNLRITILDNGPGFSREALDRLESGQSAGLGKHIGLQNIRSTLTLLYGSSKLLRAGNDADTGSARVELTIPMNPIRRTEAE